MTAPRFTKIDLDITPYYHIQSRCVRRSFLCGFDEVSGRNFNHRKQWVLNRIQFLTSIFAINVCAYAIMSNHYHLILYVNRGLGKSWSPDEIRQRWELLYPQNAELRDKRISTPEESNADINLIRDRLLSISWFMSCLNQYIAILANNEDDCTGRFWEGRFKSQALLDNGAILAAMAYVDLNPIRAKQANTPEESEFTSIQERIRTLNLQGESKNSEELIEKINKGIQPRTLIPFGNENKENNDKDPVIKFRLSDYIELVDKTGRLIREDKKGYIPHTLEPILKRLQFSSQGWLNIVKNLGAKFHCAVGQAAQMVQFGRQFRNGSPKGISISRQCYLQLA